MTRFLTRLLDRQVQSEKTVLPKLRGRFEPVTPGFSSPPAVFPSEINIGSGSPRREISPENTGSNVTPEGSFNLVIPLQKENQPNQQTPLEPVTSPGISGKAHQSAGVKEESENPSMILSGYAGSNHDRGRVEKQKKRTKKPFHKRGNDEVPVSDTLNKAANYPESQVSHLKSDNPAEKTEGILPPLPHKTTSLHETPVKVLHESSSEHSPSEFNHFNGKDNTPVISQHKGTDPVFEITEGAFKNPAWIRDGNAGLNRSPVIPKPLVQSDPAIKINIGRIEVRAVMQQISSPQLPKEALKPKISLTDYLDKKDKD